VTERGTAMTGQTDKGSDLDVAPGVLEQLQDTLSIRDAVLDVLLDKVREDRFPSPTMLDDIERILTPWRRDDYAEVLMAKIRSDRFPSRSMVERVLRLGG
jgi:hypothetical protein